MTEYIKRFWQAWCLLVTALLVTAAATTYPGQGTAWPYPPWWVYGVVAVSQFALYLQARR